MPDIDEHNLIAAAQQDPRNFDPFYQHFVKRIFAYAYRQTGCRELAEDVTASTFEKALAHIDQYHPVGSSPSAWLYKIALNEVRKSYWKQRLLHPLRDTEISPENVEGAVQANEQSRALWSAMLRLSKDDRQVLTLRFFEDLTSTEVADVLGCTVPNVYLRLHRALGRLRRLLGPHNAEGVFYASE